ncbi:hypothetical protein [Streptomyces sp. NPDC096351]|uniref:hypothetical protein n=1 Tax=Streptomyces sp. NPDC096351 TaxID=3366087 RepID=UPI0038262923
MRPDLPGPHGPTSAKPAGPTSAKPAGPASAKPAGPASAKPAGPASAKPAGLAPAEHAPATAAAALVRAHDAPGPTLVLRLDHLPRGALALGGELAWLRRALAGTPYAGIGKIALYRAAGPGRLDHRFVQALPTGFDFRAGCGHSLLACVVADDRPGPVTVRAVTTGDTVLCEHEPQQGAYTLSFLRAPTAPGTLPTGRPVDLLDGVPVSLVRYGNPYVLVDARHLPEDGLRERLEGLRVLAARLLGHPPHSALPKIAAFTAGPAGLSVRALTVGGWHPRLALTGAAALAAAGALDGTVVPPVDGEVRTPGGTVTVSTGPDRVRVHHKRAELLERLVLPWRVHATA